MRVLHVPFHFSPGQLGGTEIYVASLCRSLATLGVETAIAAPAESNGTAEFDGIDVFYFGLDPEAGFEEAYGRPDCVAADNFSAVLKTWRPDVVHLHAKSSAVSGLLVDEARLAGCKVVFTYHTPTVSCSRGTMMYMGSAPCNGELNVSRCTDCVLQGHGVHVIARALLVRTPVWIGKLIASSGRRGGVWTALRMRSLQTEGQERLHDLLEKVDRVVAVCDWVAQVLRRNGVNALKLVTSRQGLPYAPRHSVSSFPDGSDRNGVRTASEPLRMCFFGRIDPSKGADMLVRALNSIPNCDVTLDIYGIPQSGESSHSKELYTIVARDPRITLKPPLPADCVVAAMRNYDLVAVPSQCLETGPLVALEAFAAGTPLIGSRLGGIAELIQDGVDGVLVDPKDVDAWAETIANLGKNAQRLKDLRSNIGPPRGSILVAEEMKYLYEEIM